MKVCVTGGTGFLGRWFLELAPEDIDCVVLSRDPGPSELEVIETDYSHDGLEQIFDDQDFDSVIHLAGRKIEERFDLSDYLDVNVLLTDRIFKVCNEFKIDNIITASSRMVYSEVNDLPWVEDSPPVPLTYYGLSKLLKDKLVLFYANKHGLNCKSLRFAQIFGIDIENKQIQTRLFSTFIDNAIEGRSLPIYGKGEDKKEYIYVKDAVNAIFSALKMRRKQGVFNIGLGYNNTVLEIAKSINEVFENEENGYKFLQEEEEKDEHVLLDISKSEDVLEFEPAWDIKEALFDMKEIIENDYTGLS